MAGDKPLSYEALERPENFQNVLKRDRGDDCLSCKVVGKLTKLASPAAFHSSWVNTSTGTGVFMGLGAYSYFSGMSQLEQQKAKIIQSNTMFGMKSRRFGITSISLAFLGMGVWRACK